MSDTENSTKNQRGRPFQKGQSGNPLGKPKGVRHKATMIAQALLDGEAETLVRKVIDQALAGDTVCLRVCLERLVPPRKDGPIEVDLPEIQGASDLPKATAAILQAMATGDITPSEAQALVSVIEGHRKSIELAEFDQRLAALENASDKRR